MIRMIRWPLLLAAACLVAAQGVLWAEQGNGPSTIGDPQIRTDHPWFPGEISCSTFERLFETQAELYQRETGRRVATDEDKAIASWYWRNLNYYHAYCPREAFWADEITSDKESPRDAVFDYWAGLFGYGFSLCYTTHQQYIAEMEKLLGHGRSRSIDVDGHTTFEVFLKDAPYGAAGDWALLDQPNFADGTYRNGVIAEDEDSVTFYFYSPYAIAATPPKDAAKRLWAIFSAGCTNGLVVSANHTIVYFTKKTR